MGDYRQNIDFMDRPTTELGYFQVIARLDGVVAGSRTQNLTFFRYDRFVPLGCNTIITVSATIISFLI